MPYRIGKTFEFESGHMLSKHSGKCRFPHGHSRRVEIVLAADALDANDMVCDFQAIKQIIKAFIDHWDHALCLNTADPHCGFYRAAYGDRIIPFAEADPTMDVAGRDAAQKLALLASLAFNVRVSEQQMHVEGIDKLQPADIHFAGELGYVIKLLAIAERSEGSGFRVQGSGNPNALSAESARLPSSLNPEPSFA